MKRSFLTTSAGRRPFCSWPACGSKESVVANVDRLIKPGGAMSGANGTPGRSRKNSISLKPTDKRAPVVARLQRAGIRGYVPWDFAEAGFIPGFIRSLPLATQSGLIPGIIGSSPLAIKTCTSLQTTKRVAISTVFSTSTDTAKNWRYYEHSRLKNAFDCHGHKITHLANSVGRSGN